MRAGQLRHRVTLQEPTTTQDEFGAPVVTWADVATVWARVETTSGDESIDMGRASASLTHTITIRQRPGVLPTWRVLWNARVLEIASVVADNVGREMVLNCTEAV